MSNMTLAEFADRLSGIMPVVTREFLKHQNEEFYKTRITMPQFIVLEVLSKHGALKMTDLAHLLQVTTAAMTGLADRLVRDKYVERITDSKDRRVVKVILTQKGAALVHKLIEHRKQLTIKMFGMISQKEREEYLKILEHIRDHLIEQEH